MEQSEEQPDLFTISVGNIPPRTRVLVKFTYVQAYGTHRHKPMYVPLKRSLRQSL